MKLHAEQPTSANQSWLNQGTISLGPIEISAIGTLVNNALQPESEDLAKVINIVKGKIRSRPRVLVTVSSGQGLVGPASLLKAGAEKSSAVCRLSRHFSLEAFQSFLTDIKQGIQKWTVTDEFNSVEKVKEVFSIPNQLNIEGLGLQSSSDKATPEEQLKISISNLSALSKITENQLAKINPIPIGTGFLVGGRHLLTNYHVIPDKEVAQQCVAQFNYSEDEQGHLQLPIDYELAPEMLFVTEQGLDYTLVQLKSDQFALSPGYSFGWLPLAEDSESVCPGLSYLQLNIDPDIDPDTCEQVNKALRTKLEELQSHGFIAEQDWITEYEQENRIVVISTPNVQQKQGEAKLAALNISKINDELNKLRTALTEAVPREPHQEPICSIKFLAGDYGFIVHHPKGKRKQCSQYTITERGLYKQFLRYNTETDYGSSGSPVFNLKWELVALHHAVIPATADSAQEKSVQQGVRICTIVDDLKRKSVSNPKLQSFIDDFVLTQEQLDFPPLPSVLKFDGVSNCIDVTQSSEKTVDDFAPFGIEAWVNPDLSSADATIFSQVCQETWYDNFKEDSVFGQYILTLKTTPEGHLVFSREPFWKASSSAFPENGLLYPLIEEEQKHPLDILALQSIDQEEVQISRNGDGSIPVSGSESEKIKALQCILFCLGFFPDESYKNQPENYREVYLKALTGQLDGNTNKAIEEFNTWCFGDQSSTKATGELNSIASSNTKEKSSIQIGEKLIIIPSKVISLFKSRGTFLGSGTRKETGTDTATNTDVKYKNHYGLRVLELQYCLESLDWEDSFLTDNSLSDVKLFETPRIFPNGNFNWPEEWKQLELWPQATNTTAYAVRRLQRAYRQPDEGVFGALSLAALEQAKTYEVRTREKLPIGEFSHIAVTLDEKEVKIYINGQLANRRYVGSRKVGHICKALVGARTSHSTFNTQDSYTAYFKGAMSEVRLWRMTLQPKDIARRMYRRLSDNDLYDKNLVGYWRLEEGRIRETEDRHQAQTTETSIKERKYYVFNLAEQSKVYASESELQIRETNQQVSLCSACDFPTIPLPLGLKADREVRLKTTTQDLNTTSQNEGLNNESGVTVEFWIKFRYGNGKIISEGDGEEGFYTLSWINGKIQLRLNSEQQVTTIETQEAIRNTRIWHHVAFSWGATSKVVRLYLNGKLQDVVAIQAQVQTLNYETTYKSVVTFSAKQFAANHQTLKIAPKRSAPNNSKNSQSDIHEPQDFNCSIAELRIWQVVRPHSAITAYLNQRFNREEAAKNKLVGYWRFNGDENLNEQPDYGEVTSEPQDIPKSLAWIIPQSKALNFTDVDDRHWAVKFIEGLQNVGLIGSFSDRDAVQFNPDEAMLKQEFAVLLINAFGGKPNRERANAFLQFKDKKDIEPEYFADMEYVWRLGLLSGEAEQVTQRNSDNAQPAALEKEVTFGSKVNVNRGQVVAAIFDSLRSLVSTITISDAECERVLTAFSDISPQKQPFGWISAKTIAVALQQKLIIGRTANSTKLDLWEAATRAEVAAMLYQALVLHKRVDNIESDHILNVFG